MIPPKHVAIIMDGNGRWGIKNKNSRNLGHKAGLKTVETIIRSSVKNNIKFLTLYAFSTENWKRPKLEIKFLMNLLETFLIEKINNLVNQGISLKVIGDLKKFPKKIQDQLINAQNKTKKNTKLKLILALNYGSKNELVHAFKILKKKRISVNEFNISNNLFTKNIPDPDFLIRTGNTHRLSNFLLWQLAYTELFFEKKLWPDFNNNDYNRILRNFRKIQRNFGRIK